MTTATSRRVDAWSIRHAEHPPERNPKVIALLVALGVNVLPVATGATPLPGSLQDTPTWLAQGSAIFVAAGCLLCIVGLVLPKRDRGIPIEIAGTLFLGSGLFFYAFALLALPAGQRAYVFGLTIGLAVGSLLRAGQIILYVRGRRLRTEQEQHRTDG
jgi:hypothetical protein